LSPYNNHRCAVEAAPVAFALCQYLLNFVALLWLLDLGHGFNGISEDVDKAIHPYNLLSQNFCTQEQRQLMKRNAYQTLSRISIVFWQDNKSDFIKSFRILSLIFLMRFKTL